MCQTVERIPIRPPDDDNNMSCLPCTQWRGNEHHRVSTSATLQRDKRLNVLEVIHFVFGILARIRSDG